MTAPLFRADHVGSLLRPARLREAFRHHQAGRLTAEAFHAVQDEEIRRVIGLQEDAGLQAVTDGEFRRASYWSHVVDAVEGLSVAPALFTFSDDTGTRVSFTAPQVVGKLHRVVSFSSGEFGFLRAETSRTPR